jgi:PST family polysaccharide transporter
MASTIVVARLLSPDDYGVIAMTTPIAGFILIFQNFGLNQALVQAKSLSDEQVNALFFYNMAASAAIALILVLISPLVGMFYEDPRPAYVMGASAATVLMTGAGLQHTALLNRHMRYGALSAVDVTAAAVGFLATVLFAFWLRTYWALWLGTFVGAVVTALLVWRMSGWRPSWPVRWGSARSMVHFGANLTGFNILNYLSRNLDNVLIAKAWGSAALGLYDRSYKLMMFPIHNINTPLGRVMLPALSRVQDEPERYRRMYVLAIRAIALGSMPGVMAAAICSEVLVPFLLGERWRAASPIFFWLSLAAVTQPISNATGWLFISSGRTKEMLRWALFAAPITIGSFVAGLPWGPTGVAAAYFATRLILVPVLYHWSTRGSPVSAGDHYAAMIPPLVGGGLAWLAIEQFARDLPALPLLILALCLCYAFSVAVQATTPGGRMALRATGSLLHSSFLRRRTKA